MVLQAILIWAWSEDDDGNSLVCLFFPGKYRVDEDYTVLLKLLVSAKWLSKMSTSHYVPCRCLSCENL